MQGLASKDSDGKPNLVKELRESGVISEARFAFYLQNWQGGVSYLDIGLFDEGKMSDPADMVELPVLGDE